MGRILFLIINLIILLFFISCGVGYMEYAANRNPASIGSGSSGGSTSTSNDNVAPIYQSAIIVGETKTLTITFDEALKEDVATKEEDFTITSGGLANVVTGITILGATVTLILTYNVGSNEDVSIAYNGTFLKDILLNKVASFNDDNDGKIINRSSYYLCGTSVTESCYCSTTDQNDACYTTRFGAGATKYAVTKTKILKYEANTNGLKVWTQKEGTNYILRADGLDEWQKKLNLNGKGYQDGNEEIKFITDVNIFAGRVCPASVYVDDTHKTETNRCLYYDIGNPQQRLDSAGICSDLTYTTPQSCEDNLATWTTSQSIDGQIGLRNKLEYDPPLDNNSWYVGNIQTCVNKGMRLPTLFETTAPIICPSGYGFHYGDPPDPYYLCNYYPKDSDPIFSSTDDNNNTIGIPNYIGTIWTASSDISDLGCYWGSVSDGYNIYYQNRYVVCVVQ